jgi:hypothetical protein
MMPSDMQKDIRYGMMLLFLMMLKRYVKHVKSQSPEQQQEEKTSRIIQQFRAKWFSLILLQTPLIVV